jgi:PAS domain S-box-containing protein
LAALLSELGIPECICAPLICENEPLGLLIVHRSHPERALTKSDLSLLEGVASHMAVSMANARGYRKLEISEQNYRELVQSSNSVILRADPQGCINFLNRFALELFGLSEREVLGRNLVGTILPEAPQMTEEIRELFQELRRNPAQRIAKETRSLGQSGQEVWIAWTFRALFDKGGDLKEVLCIGNDITETTQTREEKEELKNRLHRARRMEAVGTLAGGVAHELNNILSGIVSYPELLLMDLSPESPLRKPVETIQKAGGKAAEIVQDLLLLSRRGVTTTEPLGLNHLVRMTLDSADHKELAARHPGVHVALSLEEDLALTPASPEHLVRALRSLVLNGFLAMPEGGTLRISTRNLRLDQDLEGYERVTSGAYAVLQVSDEGPTPGSEDLERIFEPFYTKKVLKRADTGLGLPVVWGIVKDHGGFVDVSSSPERGTTFTLYLPAVTEAARPSVFPRPAGDTLPGRGETVLVVDDVAEQRTIAADMLKRLGYRAVSMESGEAALAYLAENHADLVVLDMVMDPGMDGLETYGRILDVHPRQKAIIASGYAETDRVREARRLGAGTYLKKPYTIEKLSRAVRGELDR